MFRVRVMLLALAVVPFTAQAHAQARESARWPHSAAAEELARQFEHAAATADLAYAMRLLSAGLDPNHQYPDQQTLLHKAAQHGRLAFADLLLERGADARILDHEGRAPADVAMLAGHRDVAYMLLYIEDGAPNTSTAREDAERALQHGPDRDTRTGRDRILQFMFAAFYGDAPRMRELIAEGIDPNWAIGSYKWTPLLFAAMQGHRDIVESLLECGGDPTLRDLKNRNALDLARRFERHAVVAVLNERS